MALRIKSIAHAHHSIPYCDSFTWTALSKGYFVVSIGKPEVRHPPSIIRDG